jgi:hypothetical protein
VSLYANPYPVEEWPKYEHIPVEMRMALSSFVTRMKTRILAWPQRWPDDLDRQVEVITATMADAGEAEWAEFALVERFFSNSTPPSPVWEELPDDAPFEDRAIRLAICLGEAIQNGLAREDALLEEVRDTGIEAMVRIAEKIKAWAPYWPNGLEAQTTMILELLTSADQETLNSFLMVEKLFDVTNNPKLIHLGEGHTRRDRARRMAACMQWERDKAQAIERDEQGHSDWLNKDRNIVTRPDSNFRRLMKSDQANLIRATGPDYTCPRCQHRVPTDERPGEYEGAWSRTDHRTEICSSCGNAESWEEMAGQLVAQEEWPVEHQQTDPGTVKGFSDAWEDYRGSNRRSLAPAPLPREVPDLRLHLLEKWISGGPFEKTFQMRVNNPAYAAGNAESERFTLRQASLWWFSEEMINITISAARKIPADVRAEEIRLPADQACGLVVLGKPWIGTDSMDPGQEIRVDAFTWSPTMIDGNQCLSLSMYRYFDFAGGLSSFDLKEAVATGAIWEASEDTVGNGPPNTRSARLRGGSWIYQGRSDWPLKETLEGFEIIAGEIPGNGENYAESQLASIIEDRRFFAAFAFLIDAKLSETEMVWAARATRKRSERAGVDSKKEPSHVRLIKLRQVRRKHDETDESYEKRKREYSHRWIVNGHVAWRRCGPKGVNRRRVYIAPYMKGPEDKELIIKEDVRVWTR